MKLFKLNTKERAFKKIELFIAFFFVLFQIGTEVSKNEMLLNLWGVLKYVFFCLWCCWLIRCYRKRNKDSYYKKSFYINLISFLILGFVALICFFVFSL